MDAVGISLTGDADVTPRRHAADVDDDLHLSRLLRDEESDDDGDVVMPLAWDTRPDTCHETPCRGSTQIDPDSEPSTQIDSGQNSPIEVDSRQNIDQNSWQIIQIEPDIRQNTPIEPDSRQIIQIEPDIRQNTPIEPDSRQIIQIEPDIRQYTPIKLVSGQIIEVEPDSRQNIKVDSIDNEIDPHIAHIRRDPHNEEDSKADERTQECEIPVGHKTDEVSETNGIGFDRRLDFESNELGGSGHGLASERSCPTVHRNIEESDNEDNKSVADDRLESKDIELDQATSQLLDNRLGWSDKDTPGKVLDNEANKLGWSDKDATGHVLDNEANKLGWSDKDATGHVLDNEANKLGWSDKDATGHVLDNEANKLGWSDKDATGHVLDNEANKLGWSDKDATGHVLDNEANKLGWSDKDATGHVLDNEANKLGWSDKDATGHVLDNEANKLGWSDKDATGHVLDNEANKLGWSDKDATGHVLDNEANKLGWSDKDATGHVLDNEANKLGWSDKDATGHVLDNEANKLGWSDKDATGHVLDNEANKLGWSDKDATGHVLDNEANKLGWSDKDATGHVLDKRMEVACDDIGIAVDDSGGVAADAGVGHLLHLVRELANALPTSSYATAGGQTNLGFDATDDQSSDDSGEEIDWSWLADEAQLCAVEPRAAPRPSSWLRASMRRVRHFALGEPAPVPRVSSAPPRSLRAPADPAPVPRVCSAPPGARPRPATPPPPAVMPAATTERLPQLESPLHLAAPPLDDVIVPPETPDFPRRYSHLGRQTDDSAVQSQQQSESSADEEESECAAPEGKDRWPHSLSSLLAALGCTLGLFNVARFALLSVHFGGNFVVAFLLLSALLGWPLYALHATLGTHLRAGVVDMWHVSPVFQGVGVALLMSQAAVGLYSVVGVAWMFTYLRDSFVNKQDAYRWAENGTQLEYSVSGYFKTVVLQQEGSAGVGHLKFQVSFNLAVVWMIVFVCLSKGIKSYGKAVHVLGVVPILGLLTLTGKMLTLTPVWFDTTAWGEFLVNTNCWAAATVECFSTWGLLGAATMQLRTHAGSCRLAREVASVGLITVATLLSAALLANCFAQLLRDADFTYVPSSYEHRAVFLQCSDAPHLSSTPVSWMSHAHMIVGQQVLVPGVAADSVAGYQVVRLATELGPAVFAALGPQRLSPFWTVLFYFTLICFGVGQQLCIWHCVITGVIAINKERMQAWETTITFLSCTSAFVLGLPFTTEHGAVVLFFLDYCIGGAWWLLLLMATQIVAALMARGGEQVARSLLCGRRTFLQAALVFTWNLALPVALTVASVIWFKTNNYRDLYTGRTYGGYWPAWARRLGCLIQLAPLLTVPLVAAIQTWRHLTSGPQDLFDRLRLLCRPGSAAQSASLPATVGLTNPSTALPALTPLDDPPPKYTPPPSYATATGARIAKLLRRSFRRLVGPSSAPEPPAYSAALVELGGVAEGRPASTLSANQVARLLRSSMRRTLRSSAPGCLPDSAKPDSVILS